MSDVYVLVDGEKWEPSNDDTAEYDGIHCAAGAVLAGATEVQIINTQDYDGRSGSGE